MTDILLIVNAAMLLALCVITAAHYKRSQDTFINLGFQFTDARNVIFKISDRVREIMESSKRDTEGDETAYMRLQDTLDAILAEMSKERPQIVLPPAPTVYAAPPEAQPIVHHAHQSGHCCTILKQVGGEWIDWGGDRKPGHPDIAEALEVPGLAVRLPDGTVQLGYQGGSSVSE